jgi:hypothetical protein
MDDERKLKIALGVALFVCIMGIISVFTTTHHDYHEYLDIYKATVPFGEFVQSGSLSGVMFFGFGSISGSFSGEEFYLVKYFDGEELNTLKLDAENVPLIIDGTFQLEIISSYASGTNLFIFKWTEKPHRDTYPDYKIHIPYLPEVNQTMRSDWG